jgi:hypothetical protein
MRLRGSMGQIDWLETVRWTSIASAGCAARRTSTAYYTALLSVLIFFISSIKSLPIQSSNLWSDNPASASHIRPSSQSTML